LFDDHGPNDVVRGVLNEKTGSEKREILKAFQKALNERPNVRLVDFLYNGNSRASSDRLKF
jgi:hypothetical protein